MFHVLYSISTVAQWSLLSKVVWELKDVRQPPPSALPVAYHILKGIFKTLFCPFTDQKVQSCYRTSEKRARASSEVIMYWAMITIILDF